MHNARIQQAPTLPRTLKVATHHHRRLLFMSQDRPLVVRAPANRLVTRRSMGSSCGPHSGFNAGCIGGGTTGVNKVTTKLPCSVCPKRTRLRKLLASFLIFDP